MANTLTHLSECFAIIMGERIKAQRSKMQLTQVQLAGLVNKSRPTLANMEAGKHKIDVYMLVRIAQALSVPPGDLIPELSEAEQRLQRSRFASISAAGKAKLLAGELQKLNIPVESTGGLDDVLKEVQSQHKKSSSSSKRRSSP